MRKALTEQMAALTNQITQTDVIMNGGPDDFTAEERANALLNTIDKASELATTCLAFSGSLVITVAKGKEGLEPVKKMFEAVTEDARTMMVKHLIGFLLNEVATRGLKPEDLKKEQTGA